ncbi:acetylaminoadipate kinase [Pyrodictium occultum]|uniref:Putative [LysW]-aminoadipate/[LysW]-glutamate kinase n=2 Tax=Pyrodictium occultum TaxID=2309 RepID=A0A0V8RXK9_PYROC|nr:acetylaminoadipate kinase [Pyrodictium occultum]
MANMDNIVASVASAARRGHRLVFVHGGGDLVTEYEKRLGIEPRFVTSPQGVRSRYTTREELEVFVMVLGGLLNKRICSRLASLGARPVGLTGVDGLVLQAERRRRIVVLDPETGRKRVVEGGYTGRITSVDTGFLEKLLDNGYTPVVAPIAFDPREATLLNVDGDQAAARIAAALHADALIVLTDVDGLLLDGRLVERLTVSEARRLLEEGRVGAGMNRKLYEIARAVEEGVARAVITSASQPDPVQRGLEGRGTVVEKG